MSFIKLLYLLCSVLLILASQRIESIINIGNEDEGGEKKRSREIRGSTPTSIEWMIMVYVLGL